ncbi:MAG: alpha/beta hydrolase [Clostridia bacterium]|nr:alpha/beta hydrolase [Clostridia bacterium]
MNNEFYCPEEGYGFEIALYPCEGSKSCVVIYPGGGYFQLSVGGEGNFIARKYNDLGLSAIVVKYRIKPYTGKEIFKDGIDSLTYITRNISKLIPNIEKIATCGFSAGAHLSMCVCQHIDDDLKPDACILSSPVTTLGDGAFPTMPGIFLGDEFRNKELITEYSYWYKPDAMPPTFIWYSALDTAVDFNKNAIALKKALDNVNVDNECHEYPDGGHGSGFNGIECSRWLEHSVKFLEKRGF